MAKSVFAFTWPKVFAFRVVCKWPLEVAYHLCGTINCRDHFTLFLQGENKFYSSFSVGLTIGSRNSISSSLPSGGHGGGQEVAIPASPQVTTWDGPPLPIHVQLNMQRRCV